MNKIKLLLGALLTVSLCLFFSLLLATERSKLFFFPISDLTKLHPGEDYDDD